MQVKSVRLRLLVLALLPLVVLMPLLLAAGVNRWSNQFDALLIDNVESDLRIAEQYLQRILTLSGNDVRGLAESAEFQNALKGQQPIDQVLHRRQDELGLDYLKFVPERQAVVLAQKWPVVAGALKGGSQTAIDIFSKQDLVAESPELAKQAEIPLIATEAAVPTDRLTEDRGMVVHTATRVAVPGHEGVLVGGTLLNRNLDFIDTINDLVYRTSASGDARKGTATLFLDDVRISTNVRLFENVRALGTRVSAVVRGQVLDEGETWLNRAFVVNDWYISGYLPITDSFGKRVGMLYVGFLEAPFLATQRSAYIAVLTAFLIVMALTVPLFLRLARGIFSPLEKMTKTMRRVEEGDLDARIGGVGTQDEIGQVASHLDSLLDQVQERDRDLRAWASELNTRVDKRTEELRDANSKLEETFQQLVMSEKLASIGEITAGVAHEINNPVAVIQGNVDVIRESLEEHAQSVGTELALIDQQVQRINAIVGKLLQFARPSEFGAFDEDIDLHQSLQDCLVLVDHVLSKNNTKVEISVAPAPMVHMNQGELQQVLVNLIMNATHAMKHSGQLDLTIETETRNGLLGAVVRVADNGPGIPPETLDTVFDPFFTTKLAEGTGLGLSISQTLIQRAGGIIAVRNRVSGGAEFSVWLPEGAVQSDAAE
ncbi:MAG: sensor histidine kinase [Marinosulfonomonas sp.]